MPNLYEVAQDLVFVEAKLLAEGGEFSDEEQALLDGLEIDFDELGENIIKSIRNNEAQAEMNKNEAQFFSDRARVASNKAKAYKKFIQMCMAARQLDKIGAAESVEICPEVMPLPLLIRRLAHPKKGAA